MTSLIQIDKLFLDLESKEDKTRYPAFKQLMEITESKVSWIYDKWFCIVEKLSSDNSYQRSIGLMLLANLAKSDSECRMANVINDYLKHFDDDKFITSRQCIQCVWKIAIAHKSLQRIIVSALEKTYLETTHSHSNLIKQDVISSLAQIAKKDKSINDSIRSLLEEENDEKSKKLLKRILA